MKFFLLAVIVAILAYTTSAQEVRSKVQYKISEKDALLFIEGFALGVEAEIADVSVCVKEVTATLDDFSTAYAKLKLGFHTLSPSLVREGITHLGAGIESVTKDLKDCGVDRLVKDILALTAEIKQGGILKVLIKEVISIFHHRKDVTTEIKTFIKAYGDKDYKVAGVQVGKLVAGLLEPSN
ncbi:hypothetical protein AKO1_015391 [Acrasis kona]|uniref:Uncharacterized protein n=1 Tax=Acrasis kona TaxID=1008807 RepID=A0AAW2ZEI5_9EUKA